MKGLLLLCLGGPGPALAQAPVEGTEQLGEGRIPGIPPGPPPDPATVEPRAQAIARTLRCPVCQGLSVADSTSEAAVMFQQRIRELVSEGYTEDQIRDYFVDRYGEWILLDPQGKGTGVLLYVIPGLLLGLGAVWVGGTVAAWRKEPDEVPLPSDRGEVEMDVYERRLLEELDE